MPNHITNKLELIGSPEHIDDMIQRFGTYHKAKVRTSYDGKITLRSKAGNLDFRWMRAETGEYYDRDGVKGFGVPEGFEIDVDDSFFEFPAFNKIIPPPNDDAYNDIPSQAAVRDHPNNWYKWNIANWGTKWSAYSCERLGINRFQFETAWNAPHPVIAEIAKRCPNVHIIHTWADEDTGNNCGVNNYNSGKLTASYLPKGGSKEAYEIAFSLDPNLVDSYELVGDSYTYKETAN